MNIRNIVIAVVLGLLFYGGWFYYRNLRGWGPAFGPVTREEAPAQAGENTNVSGPVNTTGLSLTTASGISVHTFAKDLGNPRVLARDPDGTLIVSIPSSGRVVALPDRDADGAADASLTVVQGLNQPHGLAFNGGKLYVAETDQVAVYDYNRETKQATQKRKIIDLHSGGNHFSRTIGFGPDGKLYISAGSTCNVCEEKDWRRAKILVSDADGANLREYATGLRNSVFFVWHPRTREMWATDMGRDLLGDDVPFEEVNIVKDGQFYGWPYCYNNRVHDKSFDSSDEARKKCEGSVAPHITFQAHSAPLGLAFVPDSWPEQYRGDLLVSYHGSWNRSQPTGYKIVRFDLNGELRPQGESDFIAGWLAGDRTSGRPVDLLFDDKGTLFVTDDKAGTVYRVTASE